MSSLQTLGQIANFTNGGAWSQSEYSNSGVPVVRVTDIKNNTVSLAECNYLPTKLFSKYRKHELHSGDLVICTVGSHPSQPGSVVGRTATIPKVADGTLLNQNAVIVRASNNSVDQSWLNYFARTNTFHSYIKSCARGAASQVRMSIGLLKEMPVELPDAKTQTKVANILKAYDDSIENNSKRIEKLEAMARLLYRHYFETPESANWERLRLDNVLVVHRGKSYKSSELSESKGLPFVNLKCVNRGGGFRKDGLKLFTGSFKSQHQVEKGDLVMAVTDMTQDRAIVARAARVPSLDGRHGIISMDIVKIEPRNNVSKDYLYAMFRWSGFANEVKNHANGANVLHLLPARIADYVVNIPPVELQNEFGEKALLIFNLIDNLQQKNESLAKARDLLLPRLMSGGVKV